VVRVARDRRLAARTIPLMRKHLAELPAQLGRRTRSGGLGEAQKPWSAAGHVPTRGRQAQARRASVLVERPGRLRAGASPDQVSLIGVSPPDLLGIGGAVTVHETPTIVTSLGVEVNRRRGVRVGSHPLPRAAGGTHSAKAVPCSLVLRRALPIPWTLLAKMMRPRQGRGMNYGVTSTDAAADAARGAAPAPPDEDGAALLGGGRRDARLPCGLLEPGGAAASLA